MLSALRSKTQEIQTRLFGPSQQEKHRQKAKRRLENTLEGAVADSKQPTALDATTDSHPNTIPFNSTDHGLRFEYAPIRYILGITYDTQLAYEPMWLTIGIECSDGGLRQEMVHHARYTSAIARYTAESTPNDWVGFRVPTVYRPSDSEPEFTYANCTPQEAAENDLERCSVEYTFIDGEMNGDREEQTQAVPELVSGERATIPLTTD